MQTILLVKTSSVGDVVHNLPVVTDIRTVFPGARIDWVVECAYSIIPAFHREIRSTIPCNLRRWRRTWYTQSVRHEWRAFLERLRSIHYDAIIDTQGLLKSAIITRLAHGCRYGLDWESSREPLRLFYDRTFKVPWNRHAVMRNRQLAALALGYELRGEPDYGIRCAPSREAWLPPKPYVVLLHATSQPRKLWPEPSWIELGRRIAARGYSLLLPWGADEERARAERLASVLPPARVAPKLGLADLAPVLAGAAAAVGVDTGLTHLSAALGVPTVGIYGATDPQATGICAPTPAVNLGGGGRFPGVEEVSDALAQIGEPRADSQLRRPA